MLKVYSRKSLDLWALAPEDWGDAGVHSEHIHVAFFVALRLER